jgi:hypothetical protein
MDAWQCVLLVKPYPCQDTSSSGVEFNLSSKNNYDNEAFSSQRLSSGLLKNYQLLFR